LPTDVEFKDARALLLQCALPEGAPTQTFAMTDANVAAARKLLDEGLMTLSDGEVEGVLRLIVRLTDVGVEHRKRGGR